MDVRGAWLRMLIVAACGAASVAGSAACAEQAATEPAKPAVKPAPIDLDKLKPEQRLDIVARRYSEAKSYEDEGEVRSEYAVDGKAIVEVKPFKTAFERDGRFRWEFRHAIMSGGKPTHVYTVWTNNIGTYDSLWTLQGRRNSFDDLGVAMAGPTGISGGATTVVIPLLRPDLTLGERSTDLGKPEYAGREEVDGVMCLKIQGERTTVGDTGAPVSGGIATIWIDETSAIRRVRSVVQVTAAEMIPPPDGVASMSKPFMVTQTITIKPVFNAKIDDAKFAAPGEERAAETPR